MLSLVSWRRRDATFESAHSRASLSSIEIDDDHHGDPTAGVPFMVRVNTKQFPMRLRLTANTDTCGEVAQGCFAQPGLWFGEHAGIA
jgi:hypothetical protein